MPIQEDKRDFVKEAVKRAQQIYDATHSSGGKRPIDDDSAPSSDVPQKKLCGVVKDEPAMSSEMEDKVDKDAVVIETVEIPEEYVGKVIGHLGEQISQIEAETKCRVKFNTSEGRNMRRCSLEGPRSGVLRAKTFILNIVERRPLSSVRPFAKGDFNTAEGMNTSVVMDIPEWFCGTIIGKRGETIKNIEDRSGARLMVARTSGSDMSKPLRIEGDRRSVNAAREIVQKMLSSSFGDRPEQPSDRCHAPDSRRSACSVEHMYVPSRSIGLIIGKNGETIKRIIAQTGARIEFSKSDANMPTRSVEVMGTDEQIREASMMVWEIVQSCEVDVFNMRVPANKAGVVIGRGGEVIRQICTESGARVEISREPPPSEFEKVFVVKGTPQQIRHAEHLIRIKIGDLLPGTPFPEAAVKKETAETADSVNGPSEWCTSNGQHEPAGNNQPPVSWNNNNEQQKQQQPPPQQFVPAQQATQYYPPADVQQGSYMPSNNNVVAAAPFQMPTQAYQSAHPVDPSAAVAPAPAPAYTAQMDYTAQWVQYYRAVGLFDYANAIESYMKPAVAPGMPFAAAQHPMYSGFYAPMMGVPGGPVSQPMVQPMMHAAVNPSSQSVMPVSGNPTSQPVMPVPGNPASQPVMPIPGNLASQPVMPVPASSANQFATPPIPAAGPVM